MIPGCVEPPIPWDGSAQTVSALFDTGEGKRLYHMFCDTLTRHAMQARLAGGTLIAFSGGADSTLLLLLLFAHRIRTGATYTLACAHFDHAIRADSAQDALFCGDLCARLQLPFFFTRQDIPALAAATRTGLEEAARNARYFYFDEILQGRNNLSCIATAHNATDQLETVFIRLLRGAGTRGLCGIPPVRDNLIRPLLAIPAARIRAFLDSVCVAYRTDSTNEDTAYTRNYVRHMLLPLLSRLSTSPEVSVQRVCRNLREDSDFLEECAREFTQRFPTGEIPREQLSALHPALFFRVLDGLCRAAGAPVPQRTHADAVRARLRAEGDFSLHLAGCHFVCADGICRLCLPRQDAPLPEFAFLLSEGYNRYDAFCSEFIWEKDPLTVSANISPNVYKISIQANLGSAIIEGGIYVRSKRDADRYFYGGMTHTLKKVFSGLKVPRALRTRIPVVCDARGVLWVPGLAVRDDGAVAHGPFLTFRAWEGAGRLYSVREFSCGNEMKDRKA